MRRSGRISGTDPGTPVGDVRRALRECGIVPLIAAKSQIERRHPYVSSSISSDGSGGNGTASPRLADMSIAMVSSRLR